MLRPVTSAASCQTRVQPKCRSSGYLLFAEEMAYNPKVSLETPFGFGLDWATVFRDFETPAFRLKMRSTDSLIVSDPNRPNPSSVSPKPLTRRHQIQDVPPARHKSTVTETALPRTLDSGIL